MLAIQFFGAQRSPLEFVLLLVGAAVGILLISAISRLAYYTQKTHLVLLEMQHDLRKLVMLRLTSAELHRGPTIAPNPPPPDQGRDRKGAEE